MRTGLLTLLLLVPACAVPPSSQVTPQTRWPSELAWLRVHMEDALFERPADEALSLLRSRGLEVHHTSTSRSSIEWELLLPTPADWPPGLTTVLLRLTAYKRFNPPHVDHVEVVARWEGEPRLDLETILAPHSPAWLVATDDTFLDFLHRFERLTSLEVEIGRDMDVWEEGELRRGYLLRLVFGDDRASVSYFVDTGAQPQIDFCGSSE